MQPAMRYAKNLSPHCKCLDGKVVSTNFSFHLVSCYTANVPCSTCTETKRRQTATTMSNGGACSMRTSVAWCVRFSSYGCVHILMFEQKSLVSHLTIGVYSCPVHHSTLQDCNQLCPKRESIALLLLCTSFRKANRCSKWQLLYHMCVILNKNRSVVGTATSCHIFNGLFLHKTLRSLRKHGLPLIVICGTSFWYTSNMCLQA